MRHRIVVSLESDGAVYVSTDDTSLADKLDIRVIDNTVAPTSAEWQQHQLESGYRVAGAVVDPGIRDDRRFVSEVFQLPHSSTD
jgi:hypothetical protein